MSLKEEIWKLLLQDFVQVRWSSSHPTNSVRTLNEYITASESLSLSLSGLTAIFPGGLGLVSTRMSPFWVYWSYG